MKLSTRLEEIVQQIASCSKWEAERRCTRLIDIGTDHALIPISALERALIPEAIGIDKSPLPLAQARVNHHNASMRIDRLKHCLQLRCADGLEGIQTTAQDLVVMAGMGGRMMQQILMSAEQKSGGFRGTLILQPNRDLPLLRSWLYQEGWIAQTETVLKEKKHYFWTSTWYFQGKQVDSPPTLEEVHVEFGMDTWTSSPTVFQEWFGIQYAYLKKMPSQAIDPSKMDLYRKMQKILKTVHAR